VSPYVTPHSKSGKVTTKPAFSLSGSNSALNCVICSSFRQLQILEDLVVSTYPNLFSWVPWQLRSSASKPNLPMSLSLLKCASLSPKLPLQFARRDSSGAIHPRRQGFQELRHSSPIRPSERNPASPSSMKKANANRPKQFTIPPAPLKPFSGPFPKTPQAPPQPPASPPSPALQTPSKSDACRPSAVDRSAQKTPS
jgi:hypothetical protein